MQPQLPSKKEEAPRRRRRRVNSSRRRVNSPAAATCTGSKTVNLEAVCCDANAEGHRHGTALLCSPTPADLSRVARRLGGSHHATQQGAGHCSPHLLLGRAQDQLGNWTQQQR